jgi:hypothetical protein
MMPLDTDNYSFYTYQLGGQGGPKEADGRFRQSRRFFNGSNWANRFASLLSAFDCLAKEGRFLGRKAASERTIRTPTVIYVNNDERYLDHRLGGLPPA